MNQNLMIKQICFIIKVYAANLKNQKHVNIKKEK